VKDLPRYVREHRGELIWAALTLIQHWMAQGKPVPHVKPLGSYERWSVVIGGILESAHIPGFLEDMEDFYATADADAAPARALVAAWWKRHQDRPVGAKELLEIAVGIDGLELRGSNDRGMRTALGIILRGYKDRVFGDLCVKSAGESHGAGLWKLVNIRTGTGEPHEPGEPLTPQDKKIAENNDDVEGEISSRGSRGSPNLPLMSCGPDHSPRDPYEPALTFPEQSVAPAKQVDVDKPLTDTANVSREKTGSRRSNPWLFGNGTAKSAPVDDGDADFMGEPVDNPEEEMF
jgi:hypothetical protein